MDNNRNFRRDRFEFSSFFFLLRNQLDFDFETELIFSFTFSIRQILGNSIPDIIYTVYSNLLIIYLAI